MKPKAIVNLLWDNQLPVLRQFLFQHEPMVVITAREGMTEDARQLLADTSCDMVSLASLLEAELGRIGAEAQALRARFADFLGAQVWRSRFPEEGSTTQLADILSDCLAEELPFALQLLDGLAIAAEKFDIVLLVVSEDVTRLGRTATTWAKAHGIPSLHVEHGVSLVDLMTAHGELVADKLAVYSQRGMESYLDIGVPAERLAVTGNPAWDSYAELIPQKAHIREQLCEKYRLDPALPIVVFGTTWAGSLTAYSNESVHGDTLLAFINACETLRQHGLHFHAIIKDRPANSQEGAQYCYEMVAALGAEQHHYTYCVEDTQQFAVAADVLIAVDSNYLIEGMLAGTPLINLMNTVGMLLGPPFEAEAGILEVEAPDLAAAIQLLLTDKTARTDQQQLMRQRLPYYHHAGCDGKSAERVAQLMSQMAPGLPARKYRYIWQRCLDTENTDLMAGYHITGRQDLTDMFSNRPARLLDIGCAGGANGELLKQRFPDCQVWGIETNRAAAEVAASKLDKVLVGRFEDIDLETEGIARGTLDGVLLADVLEHMYNPWQVMVKLRDYLSPRGQVVISIPNVRNLALMGDLAEGHFTYLPAGLLDITHIRFFTLREIRKLCRETGYKEVLKLNTIDPSLDDLFERAKPALPCNIEIGRMLLKNVSYEEMLELCTLQFFLLLEKDERA